jgi:hypothetical protein
MVAGWVWETRADQMPLRIPKLRYGSYFSFLPTPRAALRLVGGVRKSCTRAGAVPRRYCSLACFSAERGTLAKVVERWT